MSLFIATASWPCCLQLHTGILMLAVAVAMTVAIGNVAGWCHCHCAIAIAIAVAVAVAVAVTVAIAVAIPLLSHLQIHNCQLIIVQIFYFSVAVTSGVAYLLSVEKIFESLFFCNQRSRRSMIDCTFHRQDSLSFFTYFLQAGQDGLQMCKYFLSANRLILLVPGLWLSWFWSFRISSPSGLLCLSTGHHGLQKWHNDDYYSESNLVVLGLLPGTAVSVTCIHRLGPRTVMLIMTCTAFWRLGPIALKYGPRPYRPRVLPPATVCQQFAGSTGKLCFTFLVGFRSTRDIRQ